MMAVAEILKPHSLTATSPACFQLLQSQRVTSGRGCLLQIYPARASSEMIRLEARRTVIGRDLSCDVTLDDKAASRHHALIEGDEHGYVLVDLGSTNGTWIDDRIARDWRRLTGGELIRMGGTIFKFMSAIDEEAQYHAVVHELMTRDPLTNTFNRAYLLPALEKMLLNSSHTGTPMSVILLDIDFFKKINDAHGHLAGDEVLRIFCERIRVCLRSSDILARLGGEEFVVVTPSVQRQEARQLAERLRLTVASTPFQTQAGLLPVTCSLGVSWTDGTLFHSVDAFLGNADRWLYTAKNSGRNRVRGPADCDA